MAEPIAVEAKYEAQTAGREEVSNIAAKPASVTEAPAPAAPTAARKENVKVEPILKEKENLIALSMKELNSIAEKKENIRALSTDDEQFDNEVLLMEQGGNAKTQTISTENINEDLVKEIRKNILTKIDEYNVKIAKEESRYISLKDNLLNKKKGQTKLGAEINQEKREFYEKIRKDKELFQKKQEEDMNYFWEYIR